MTQRTPESKTTELIGQLKARNRNAYATLYDMYSPFCFGMISDKIKDEPLAEDLLQQVFTTVWQKIGDCPDERKNLLRWVVSITEAVCADVDLNKETTAKGDIQTGITYESCPIQPEALGR